MSRSFRILAALAVFGSCLAAALSGAIVARAATTVRAETALLDAPSWEGGVLLTLPAGAEVAIAGAPDGSFLPVRAGDVFGWVPSAAVSADKAGAPPAQWEEPETASAAQETDALPPTTEELPTVPPAPEVTGDESLATDPSPDVVPVPEAGPGEPAQPVAETPPVVTPAPDAPAEQGDAPAPDAPLADAPTADVAPAATPGPDHEPSSPTDNDPTLLPGATATATPGAGDPSLAPAADAPPAEESAATAPPTLSPEPALTTDPAAPTPPTLPPPAKSTPAPSPTPLPTPEPLIDGPATVATDAGLFEWPGFEAPIVFMVPAGSLVNLQGEASNGFVQAEFMWMYGWIAADLLQPAAEPEGETIPEDAEVEAVRTSRAGSGMAKTTVDLAMRAGPSAGEAEVGNVPAGARVELTGVMQNDFQRVIYKGQIGWIANEYLELPATPTPEATGSGKGKSDAKNRPHYSERQIIRIISNAADRYGQNREDMLRVARCESALDPYAVNPSGSYGLFQFIRSTWESTPYGDEDIFDPVANANAAGWMWKQGRQSEWVCK